tara:strand:+ start:175 stop:354 length:180 start_codon:yes stop_codon:yes gene_type:complete
MELNMDKNRAQQQVIQIYLELLLKYKRLEVGDETPEGYLVTEDVVQLFADRLYKYLAKK